MKKFPEVRLITLDLDGVLIDSINVMKTSWEKSMNNFNLQIPITDFQVNIVLSLEKILKKTVNNINNYESEKIVRYYKKIAFENLDKVVTYPKIDVFLDYLSINYKLAILTSKSSERVHKIIDQNFSKINFENIICSDNLTESKPHPEGLNKLLKDHNLNSKQLAFVGDTIFDQQAAERADCIFGFANWGYGNVLKYDFKINTPEHIKEFF